MKYTILRLFLSALVLGAWGYVLSIMAQIVVGIDAVYFGYG